MDDVIIYTDKKTTTETLLFAQELGMKEISILFETITPKNAEQYKELQEHKVLTATLHSAVVVKNSQEAAKARQQYDFVYAVLTRELVENKHVDVVYGAESLERKDKLHWRSSGMNHIIAKLLANKTYAFDISQLQGKTMPKNLGRMMANKRLLVKYGAKMTAYSFAREKLELRTAKERAFFLKEM